MSKTRILDGGSFDAVLFDLDGTLVDTAPDMVALLQSLQCEHDVDPVPYDLGRSNVSNGAWGLIRIGFPERDDDFLTQRHAEYMERYAAAVCVHSTLFPELGALLDELDASAIPWGVVTNKPERMTLPLLAALGLRHRATCTVSGDTIAERKPDPGPLLHASAVAGLVPGRTIYIGDAARDIEAGRAAGMATIAASYGYITADDDPARWNADIIAADTAELAQIVRKAVSLD